MILHYPNHPGDAYRVEKDTDVPGGEAYRVVNAGTGSLVWSTGHLTVALAVASRRNGRDMTPGPEERPRDFYTHDSWFTPAPPGEGA